jgi:hypothetical protein
MSTISSTPSRLKNGAITTVKRVTETLKARGFKLNQWVSSPRLVLALIPESERIHSSLNLDFDELPVERSLGIFFKGIYSPMANVTNLLSSHDKIQKSN